MNRVDLAATPRDAQHDTAHKHQSTPRAGGDVSRLSGVVRFRPLSRIYSADIGINLEEGDDKYI